MTDIEEPERRSCRLGKSGQPWFQVLVGTVAGILLGHFAPGTTVAIKLFGDAFTKMIQMMIVPIIFVTVVHSVAGTNDMKAVERVALKSFVYFEAITIVALIFGLVAVERWRPGVGMNIDAGAIDTVAIKTSIATAHDQPIGGDLLHIIPSAFPGALTDREVLQVLSISVLSIAVSFPASARSRWSTASRAPRAGDA